MSTPRRPSLQHARTVRIVMTTVTILGFFATLIIFATGGLNTNPNRSNIQIPATATPWDYTVDEWDQALGGDEGLTDKNYDQLNDYKTDHIKDSELLALKEVARLTILADLTTQNQEGIKKLTPTSLTPYWPSATRLATPQCTNINILAISPTYLPVHIDKNTDTPPFTTYAKVLIAFTGTCQGIEYTKESPEIRYVYAGQNKENWIPLRTWQIPAQKEFDTLPGATEPYDWELKPLTDICSPNYLVRARIPVVDAFDTLCNDAASDGITITATSGYRSRAEQAMLFEEALARYGTVEAARKRVAYADNKICTSRHCSGLALNVEETPETITWLQKTVACRKEDNTLEEATSCAPNETPIPNSARYGFTAPHPQSPGYLEFTFPVGVDHNSSLATPNCEPNGIPIANQISSIFRCRLSREGIVGPEQDKVVAEALTVSRCESGWNATAAAFAGRYATTPHPITGKTYTNKGVFMLTDTHVQEAWLDNGDPLNPIANINAAAKLWITTRSWDEFGCATGTTDGFQAGPVLPQYGGPDVPDWAFLY